MAIEFGGEGASVIVAARTVEEYDERLPGTVHDTVSEIERRGGTAIAVQCDVAVQEQLERLVLAARNAFGPVDVLVNNAALTVPSKPPNPSQGDTVARSHVGGRQRGVGFLDFPLKGFRRHFDVNVFAAFRLMQLVLPDMLAAGRGAIVNVSAEAARVPGDGPYPDARGTTGFAYGGSKAALEHLTRSVAYEVAHRGVVVNALVPSLPISTPGVIAGRRKYATDDCESEEDFAAAAVHLALAEASVLTGQVVYSQDVLHPELGRRGWLGGRL
jgi:NAD(P)-dependent dehydrogenase (short-subunit alcohol dehydrogenase family)